MVEIVGCNLQPRSRPVGTLRQPGGFTLVEAVLAMALFSLVAVAFTRSVDLGMSESRALEDTVDLRMSGHAALEELTWALRNSAFTSDGAYPQLLTPAEFAVNGWGVAAPVPSTLSAWANRGVVFTLPADADSDERPDVSAGGDLIWSPQENALVIVPDGTGGNRVEWWIDGAFNSVVCRGVETLTVDSNATSPTELSLGALRLRIVLGRFDGERSYSVEVERTIRILQEA